METVEFEDDNEFKPLGRSNKTPSKITLMLIKHHIAKDQRQADIVMLSAAVVCLVASALIIKIYLFPSHSQLQLTNPTLPTSLRNPLISHE